MITTFLERYRKQYASCGAVGEIFYDVSRLLSAGKKKLRSFECFNFHQLLRGSLSYTIVLDEELLDGILEVVDLALELRPLVVALQVAFERQTLKPVF
jgi:hypothetical protein